MKFIQLKSTDIIEVLQKTFALGLFGCKEENAFEGRKTRKNYINISTIIFLQCFFFQTFYMLTVPLRTRILIFFRISLFLMCFCTRT